MFAEALEMGNKRDNRIAIIKGLIKELAVPFNGASTVWGQLNDEAVEGHTSHKEL